MQLAAKGYDALKGYGQQVGRGYQSMAELGGASPELGAAIGTGAETLITGAPDILSAAAGLKGAQSLSKPRAGTAEAPSAGEVRSAVVDAAPSIDELKSKSRELYKSIDDSGAKINEDSYLDLVVNIRDKVKTEGHRAKLNPKSEAVLRELESEIDMTHKVSDIDSLRKVAQQAAGSIEPADARMGSIIIDEIDDYLDNLKPKDIRGDIAPEKIGKTYQQARELWRRNKKVNLLEDADIRADLAASGYENGLRQEFTRILKDKKKRRAFNAKEIREMEAIAKGTKGSNAAKFLGKFGLSEGRATSMVGSSIAALGGTAATGSPLGGAAALSAGQFSKKLAQRLTRGKATFADAIVRAGDNGEEIARAYLRNTPKAQRSASELKELFLERRVTPDNLIELQSSNDKAIAAGALAAEVALRKQRRARKCHKLDQ